MLTQEEVQARPGTRWRNRRVERVFSLAACGASFGGVSGIAMLVRLLAIAVFSGQKQPAASPGLIVWFLSIRVAAAVGGLLVMAAISVVGGRQRRLGGALNGAIAGAVGLTGAGLACILGL